MKTIKEAKWCYIICSILLCVLGIIIVITPHISAVKLCCIVGIIAIIYGLSKIFGYISHDLYNLAFQFDLSLGIFTVAFGLILLIRAEHIVNFIPLIIGLFVFIDGIFKLQTAIDAKKFGLINWWLILLGSLLCAILSLFLIFNPFKAGDIAMIFVGIALTLDGLQNLLNAFLTVKILKKDRII